MYPTPCTPHPTPYTRRQSVLYLPEPLVVSRNESINGTLSLAPNARNHRDLDFVLSYTHKGKIEGTKSDTREYKMR